MSNARRIAERDKVKAPRQPRVKKVKIDLSTLPDAIVDGKLVVPIKGKVLFERTINKKTAIHEGHIWGFDEAKGDVSIWDETRGQFYGFNLNQAHLVVVKAAP